MIPKVISIDEAEPISLIEARAHLEAQPYSDSEVDTIDDTMIEGWIGAAREHCENFLGLSLTTRTLEIALDTFPVARGSSWRIGGRVWPIDGGIDLPMGPVRQVLTISWGDESDDEMADYEFVLDTYAKPSRIVPLATGWPTVTCATNVIKVRYIAGYGVDSDGGEPVPKAVRAAMLLILGHLFRNREETTEAAMNTIPLGAEILMRPYRVRLGMA